MPETAKLGSTTVTAVMIRIGRYQIRYHNQLPALFCLAKLRRSDLNQKNKPSRIARNTPVHKAKPTTPKYSNAVRIDETPCVMTNAKC